MINDIHHQSSTINYLLSTIKEGAIFIADSHYNKERNELVTILEKIKSGDIQTTQLFLMGDIFDFLCEESNYFKTVNQEPISIINELSQKIEIYYFEGNHDFNLASIFPKVKVFPRNIQPVAFGLHTNMIAYLSHGDIYTNNIYNLYCKVIRNSLLLKIVNLFDFNNFITKKIAKKLAIKNICKKLDNFDDFMISRINSYPPCDYIIEGHFHQCSSLLYANKNYFNLPSAFCSKMYARMSQKSIKLEHLNIND
ncbi:UDP-2,3-diacylglucosamine diphosphatase [Arcobacter sp. FWKO B]|uniref:UDP-2,3-diacylglucosamine diphosphatase n=1 Tax=Arcobacter sp. FWKO B TaxID=2593672 RepID=UPI0018A3BDCB|nr:metallophosphoesterase [Arcobacter sp. FWKO B]QOG13097.1 UDP-2,3-diacylglucosamine diphosphatase [Arcobacter sp. FWKO B]